MKVITPLFLAMVVLTHALFAGSSPKKAVAVRTANAPRIDGVLSEEIWQKAIPISDFVQYEPLEGEAPTQPTEVRILYDDEALYIGWTMKDPAPEQIVARLARRDDEPEADYVSVRLDSFHDHQTAFEFTLNAAGVKTDVLISNDGTEEDASWDVVWDAETSIGAEGWTAEMKIPFTALRFSEGANPEWGVQLIRYISRKRERQHWVLIRKSESGYVSKFGHLVGLGQLSKPANVEVLPYVMGGNRFASTTASSTRGSEFTPNMGVDLKFKPSAGLTVDATLNPDFGQVEADPAVLNLSTFETFYPEKRPFFIEGSQILRFTTFGGDFGPGLFYSRRIGRAISLEPPEGGYIEKEPRFATILGAAKISGKTADGLSIGALEAVTAEETATLVDSTGVSSVQTVEPLTNFSLVRLRKDVFGNSNAGFMITSVNRKGRLPAMTSGADWNLKSEDSEYRINGFLAVSRTTIPGGLRGDGSAGKIGFNKDGGAHWRGNIDFDFTSRKFNINDMGFFRRPNDYGTVSSLLYRDDRVTDWKRITNLSATYHLRRNFDGAELINAVGVAGYVMLPNYWELGVQAERDYGRYDDRETRRNGLFRKARNQSIYVAVESDPRQVVVADLEARFGSDERKLRSVRFNGDIEVKAASNISLQFSLSRNEFSHQFAWVDNIVDTVVSPGLISIFADRATSEWDFTTRGSFIFSRDLTFQVYIQLFLAKGRLENFARLTAPDRWIGYAFTKPDFNRKALNSNLVLRWEYLPGSTLYLVWSQARDGERGSYASRLRDDVAGVFALPMTNVLLLKISYWLNL